MPFVLDSLRRAQPWLGTFVEIEARGADSATLDLAVESAFQAIRKVHALMNYHDRQSELSRLNALAHRIPLRVHAWTYEVLRKAACVSAATDGDFDVTRTRGGWEQIALLPGRQVMLRRPGLQIDLGGIAKGFAVDRAVAAMRRFRVPCGSANAGGDLRVFGDQETVVRIRNPRHPNAPMCEVPLRNGAIATSGSYFGAEHVDPRENRPCPGTDSVSVRAPECWLADALTKLVIIRGVRALPMLERFSAEALVADGDGITSQSVSDESQ
jgi:thiamine biosynthesis lipoprotein